MKRDKFIIHYCAGGVVYYKGKVVMLCDRYGRLVLPKGHIAPKEKTEHAARREVTEETGYKDIKIVKELNTEEFNYTVKDVAHRKIVNNFLFELEHEEKSTPHLEPQEIYQVVWVLLEDAIDKAHFTNTKILLKDVKKYYDKGKSKK